MADPADRRAWLLARIKSAERVVADDLGDPELRAFACRELTRAAAALADMEAQP